MEEHQELGGMMQSPMMARVPMEQPVPRQPSDTKRSKSKKRNKEAMPFQDQMFKALKGISKQVATIKKLVEEHYGGDLPIHQSSSSASQRSSTASNHVVPMVHASEIDEDGVAVVTKKTRKKRKKQTKLPGQPKKPLTAYMCYLQHVRNTPALVGNLSPRDLVSEYAKKWKAMSAEERSQWTEMAAGKKREWVIATEKFKEDINAARVRGMIPSSATMDVNQQMTPFQQQQLISQQQQQLLDPETVPTQRATPSTHGLSYGQQQQIAFSPHEYILGGSHPSTVLQPSIISHSQEPAAKRHKKNKKKKKKKKKKSKRKSDSSSSDSSSSDSNDLTSGDDSG